MLYFSQTHIGIATVTRDFLEPFADGSFYILPLFQHIRKVGLTSQLTILYLGFPRQVFYRTTYAVCDMIFPCVLFEPFQSIL